MRKQLLLFFIKFSFYCILVLTFVRFYLNDQFRDFFEKRTTVTTKFEEAQALEFPTLTFCIHPAGKTSVAEKFGLNNFADIFVKKASSNLSITQRFGAISYELTQDFEITVQASYLVTSKQTTLKLGLTNFTFHNQTWRFDTKPLRTYFMGTCYKVQPLFEVKNSMPLYWRVIMKVNNSMDQPKGLYLYLTSNQTWNGIPFQRWPRYHPTKLILPFQQGDFNKIFWRVVQQKYQSGVQNTSQCLNEGLQKYGNHGQYCQFFSDGFDLPTCQSTADLQKLMVEVLAEQWYSDCFKLKQATTYHVEHIEPQSYKQPNVSFLLFNIELNSMEQEIREEIPIITSQALIGSVGGSLGMFFGFSISTSFIYFLNKALHQ